MMSKKLEDKTETIPDQLCRGEKCLRKESKQGIGLVPPLIKGEVAVGALRLWSYS